MMNSETAKPQSVFTRRKILSVFLLSIVGAAIFLSGAETSSSLQTEVEAIGGTYAVQEMNSPISWKNPLRALHNLVQMALGRKRPSISLHFDETDVPVEWMERNASDLSSLPIHHLTFYQTKINDEAAMYLAGMNSVVMLTIRDAPVTNDSMVAIRAMTNLQLLDLTGTAIGPAGIETLSDHPKVRHLAIDGSVLTDSTVTYLNSMPQLRGLALTDFNDEQLGRLTHLKGLSELTLTAVTDESLPHILNLNALKYLALEDSELSPQSLETIRAALPGLDIRQRMSVETAKKMGVYRMMAARRTGETIVAVAIAVVAVLCIVTLWTSRWGKRLRNAIR